MLKFSREPVPQRKNRIALSAARAGTITAPETISRDHGLRMQGSRHTCAISTSTTQVNANSANQTPRTYLISKIRDPNHDSHYVNLKESFLQGCLVDCLLALQDWLRQGIHMLNTKACSIKNIVQSH